MTDRSNNVRRMNLNLLPVLLKILHTRNITQAAISLHLTQSATSGYLKRLREVFSDELLVPNGRELVLTKKAKALLPQLEELLYKASVLIEEPTFDPATDTSRIRLATADWIAALLIPKMSKHMNKYAPNMSVEFVQGSLPSMIEDVRKGFTDILIGPKEVLEWCNFGTSTDHPDYCLEHCFKDDLVGIESLALPPSKIDSDLDSYLARPHITFYFHPQKNVSIERQALSKLALTQHDQFLVPTVASLPYVVATTEMVAVVPLSLAEQFSASFPIRIFRPPLEFDSIDLIMVWSKARRKDQVLIWARSLIKDSFAQVGLCQEPRLAE